jgi:hypothetical protein
MSAPSLDINAGKSGAPGVPIVSRKTAFSCLDRICGSDAMRLQTKAIAAIDNAEESVLPVDRLIAIAGKSGLPLQTAHFDWRALLIATATKPVLLLLRNSNAIAVLGTGRDGVEEVVVSDPLYQNGEPFFLPRLALEHAWGGDALVVKPKRGKTERALTWYLSILSLCAVTAAILLVFQSTIGVTIAGSHGARENSAAVAQNEAMIPQNEARAAPDETPPVAATTDADSQPGAGVTEAANFTRADDAPPLAAPPEAVNAPIAEPVQPTEQPAPVENSAVKSAETGSSASAESPPKPAAPAPPEAEQVVALAAPPQTPGLSGDEIAALIARGDALIIQGDVASARLFYEHAADAADGQAALRLGETYDPAFLARAHLSGARGDAPTAARWYRRARELGTGEAEALLRTLSPK